MRSGFLNVSSSDVPASSSGSVLQGSRNKRKFRTDQQASLPFRPALSFDDVHTIQSVNDAAVECLPFNAVSTGSVSVENGGCHDHFSSQSSMSSGKTHLPQYGIPAAADCFSAFHHYTYSRIEPGYINTWLPDWDQYTEVQLEQILISMLDMIYKDAMSQITSCGYSQEEALNALLKNDRWNGIDALTIIVENSIAWLRSRESMGVDVDITFSNFKEMESYVLTEMICMLRKIGNPTASRRSHIGEVWIQSNVSGNVTSAAIGSSSSGAELTLTAPPLDSGGDHCYDNNKGESLVNVFKAPDDVSRMLAYVDSENEEGKTDYLWQLADRVKALESQIQCWTDWAQQKVMQAARRLSKYSTELKALRQEREEYLRLKKEKQGLEESTKKKLAEMEVSFRKALSQVERANSAAWRLENENAKVRAEMEAAKLMAAESVIVCREATKREKKSIKNVQGWEKQKLKLQEELAGEKQKLSGCLEQLAQARERQQQAEARWRQEKAAKEAALTLVDSEKKGKEDAEHSAKRREVARQRKSETESVSYGEEIQKLESEIARVKLSLGIQPPIMKWGSGFGNNLDICSAERLQQMNACLLSEIAELRNSKNEVHQDGDCVMCMNEEVSILFLPCAHEVLCVKCNEAHETQGLKECPFCRAVIHQRIHVYGVRS